MEIKKTTYKTASKTIANATAAGTFTAETKLDDNYDLCTGIAFSDNSDGLGSNYTVAVSNQLGVIMQAVPAAALVAGRKDGSSPNERFLDLPFALRGGNEITVTIVSTQAASADITVSATFKCVQTNKPVSI